MLWASLVGTSLESYDFYVFSYLSAFFLGPLFFEPLGVFGGTLAAFLTNALGFVARPLGAIVFGHLGDRIGRRKTLILTITIMGVATGLIGLLPDFATAGYLGAVLLVTLRLIQGFSLGGEWGGAILLATEHADKKKHAFYAAFPQLGLADRVDPHRGALPVAAGAARRPTTCSRGAGVSRSWSRSRCCSCRCGCGGRSTRPRSSPNSSRRSSASGCRSRWCSARSRSPSCSASGAALLGIGSYSLMNTYTLNYGAVQLGYDYNQLLLATTIGALLQLVTIPLFGVWANRIGSARVVLIGAIGTLIVAFPIYFLLQSASFGVLVGMMIIGGILPTMSWAALGGLLSELFGARIRYSGISFAYAIAAIISGFVLPMTLAFGEATAYAWWHPGSRARGDVAHHRGVGVLRRTPGRADRGALARSRGAGGERGQQPGGRGGVVHRDDERPAVAAQHLERLARPR